MDDLWTLGLDPGTGSGGACLLSPTLEPLLLCGWFNHKTRGTELHILNSGAFPVVTGAVGVAGAIATAVRALRGDRGLLELHSEEPIYNPRNPAGGLSTFRSIGQFEGALDRPATLVPYRTWVRHHGMRPGDGAAEIKASVLDLVAHLVGTWKAPVKVREGAAEAYLIALCARGATP